MDLPYIRLRPSVSVLDAGATIYLIGEPGMTFQGAPAPLRCALKELGDERGTTRDRLAELFGDEAAATWLAARLREAGALQASGAPFSAVSSDPTAAYFESIVDGGASGSLTSHHVLIVGCGGIGALVAQHLVAAGVGRLTLVDFDRVQASNLNRQFLFTAADVGRDKLEAAREHLRALGGTTRIDLVRRRVERPEDVRPSNGSHVDAVVCAADTPPVKIRDIVSRAATSLGATFAGAGVGLFEAHWGPILTREDPVAFHEWPGRIALPSAAIDRLERPLAMSFGPTNSFAAACLARDLVHVLLGQEAPSRGAQVSYDFRTLRTQRRMVTAAADG